MPRLLGHGTKLEWISSSGDCKLNSEIPLRMDLARPVSSLSDLGWLEPLPIPLPHQAMLLNAQNAWGPKFPFLLPPWMGDSPSPPFPSLLPPRSLAHWAHHHLHYCDICWSTGWVFCSQDAGEGRFTPSHCSLASKPLFLSTVGTLLLLAWLISHVCSAQGKCSSVLIIAINYDCNLKYRSGKKH